MTGRILSVLRDLARGRALPEPFALPGVARDPLSRDELREIAAGAVRHVHGARWRIVDPLLEAWWSSDEPPAAHPAGSQGPPTTDALPAPGDARRPI